MKTYRQSLDELHFTREEKTAMVDRLTAGESRGGAGRCAPSAAP